jgi:hypothetical protein
LFHISVYSPGKKTMLLSRAAKENPVWHNIARLGA